MPTGESGSTVPLPRPDFRTRPLLAPVEPGPEIAPQRLGPCRIVRALGSGGMGTVYLAVMEEDRTGCPAGTEVAVKVLHPQVLRDATGIARFLREARLGASLDHPAVVRTYLAESVEVGHHEHHFLVMEHVEGRTLRELMGELQVVPEALLRYLAQQIASGLAAIHAAGAVHRDLKPENVLITPDHQVKVMDLGVAQILEETVRMSQAGGFVGTLHYAAPEQFSGGRIGPATDLYALGVVLYEAATGNQPFAAVGLHQVVRRHLERVPAKAGQLNPQLTPFFEEVVASLLEKEPADRFASAGELTRVLEEGEESAWWCGREQRLRAASPHGELRRMRVARETSVLGRGREIDFLRVLYREAAGGRGRLVLLEGEAGVGKTRLLDELVRRLREDGEDPIVLYGSNPPGRVGDGHVALVQGVLSHFGETALEPGLREVLTVTPALVPAFASYLTGAPLPPGVEPLSAEAVHAVFCHLASALSAERPLVWIVDDLHFGSADGSTLLVTLARAAEERRILLVATTRPGLATEDLAHLERLSITRRLPLRRLADRDVVQVLREALHSEALATQLADEVAQRSDGNPFFVFEILRGLKESGCLKALPDGSFIATRDVGAVEVPSSVRELLRSRLRDLNERERAVLDAGAVEGFRFDPDLAARVLGRKRLEVLQALAGLERRSGVVRATGTGFQFDHHLLQEVIYADLPPLLRAEYHALFARAYEERAGLAGVPPADVPAEAAVFLAEHALKGDVTEIGNRLALPALRSLAARYRNEALLELAELALATVAANAPALRAEVLLVQAECNERMGRLEAQRRAVEGAMAAAAASGSASLEARARYRQGRLCAGVADYAGAEKSLRAAIAAARAAVDRATEGHALGDLAIAVAALGRYEEARENLEQALALSVGLGDLTGEARATCSLGVLFHDLGQYEPALEHFERQRGLYQSIGNRQGEAAAVGNVGVALQAVGRYDEAKACFEQQLGLCRAIGDRPREAMAIGNLGIVYHHLGHYARARAHCQRYLEQNRVLGNRQGEAIAFLNLGRVAFEEGRAEAARELFIRCREVAKGIGTRRIEGWAIYGLGDVARALVDPTAARACYEEAMALHRSLGTKEGLVDALFGLGRVCAEQGEREEAVTLLTEAAGLTAELALTDPGPLPAAYLALLGEREPRSVEVDRPAPVSVRAEAHVVLFRAGGGERHLESAQMLLERMCEHLEGDERAAFWSRHPTARLLAEHEALV